MLLQWQASSKFQDKHNTRKAGKVEGWLYLQITRYTDLQLTSVGVNSANNMTELLTTEQVNCLISGNIWCSPEMGTVHKLLDLEDVPEYDKMLWILCAQRKRIARWNELQKKLCSKLEVIFI